MFILANFIEAVATIAKWALDLFMYIIIARAVLSWVNPDPFNPIVRFIHNTTEPVLYRVRRLLPIAGGGFDFSPIIVIILIYAASNLLISILR
jgi:YggT family protein